MEKCKENKKYKEFLNKLVIITLLRGDYQKGILLSETDEDLILHTLSGKNYVSKSAVASIRNAGGQI